MTTQPNYYETDRALSEYLLFHYGADDQILPWTFGPREALHFPERCVREMINPKCVDAAGRALDLGCAVGRSTFELARHCEDVTGIDFSDRFIAVASHLQRQGSITYGIVEEGDLTTPATAVVPVEIDRTRVRFEQGDAQRLRADLGSFDVVVMANLIDRLGQPRLCLERLPSLVKPGGQLILTSPYTWLEDYAKKDDWLGGVERDGVPVRTLETLQRLLSPDFELEFTRDLPFLIREHARKYQWSVAQGSRWARRSSSTAL